MSFRSGTTNSAINFEGYFDPIKPFVLNPNQPQLEKQVHPELAFAPPYGWDPKYKTDIMGSGRISGGRSYTRAALKGGRSYTRAALKGGKSYTRAALKGGRSYTRAALKGGDNGLNSSAMNVLDHIGDDMWQAIMDQAAALGQSAVDAIKSPETLKFITDSAGGWLKTWFKGLFSGRSKNTIATRPTEAGKRACEYLAEVEKQSPVLFNQIIELMKKYRRERLLAAAVSANSPASLPDFA